MEIDWARYYRVSSMQKVLIDACGWVAVIEAGINIDKALLESSGISKITTTQSVISELESLDGNLLLDMLTAKAELIEPLVGSGKHTDDQLFDLAKKYSCPILTVDTELKRRLSQENLSWIEVSGRSHLRMIRAE